MCPTWYVHATKRFCKRSIQDTPILSFQFASFRENITIAFLSSWLKTSQSATCFLSGRSPMQVYGWPAMSRSLRGTAFTYILDKMFACVPHFTRTSTSNMPYLALEKGLGIEGLRRKVREVGNVEGSSWLIGLRAYPERRDTARTCQISTDSHFKHIPFHKCIQTNPDNISNMRTVVIVFYSIRIYP